VPLYPRAPPQTTYREYLQKLVGASGSVEAANTAANRVRWILDCTMTAKGAFEYRREELAILSGGSTNDEVISDDAVATSFLESISRDDGIVWRYLERAELAALIGCTLFIHGGVPDGAAGWVPTLEMRYETPDASAPVGGRVLPDGHSVASWVTAINDFMREALREYRGQMEWQAEGEVSDDRSERRRGGEALMAMTSTPASWKRSLVTESMLQQGSPMPASPLTEEYFWTRGVRRVVCGHKPCGDSPFVVTPSASSGVRIEYVHGDTTYSDQSAPDSRGEALAAIELEGDMAALGASRVRLRGTLVGGKRYDFCLPARDASDASGVGELAPPSGSGAAEVAVAVGRQLPGNRWVKAILDDGSFHVARLEPGDRVVRYETIPPSVAEAMAGADHDDQPPLKTSKVSE